MSRFTKAKISFNGKTVRADLDYNYNWTAQSEADQEELYVLVGLPCAIARAIKTGRGECDNVVVEME